MAEPITWRNVNSRFDISGASAALARAGQSVNSGFKGLEDILAGQQQINADNRQNLIDNSTQDFLNKLSVYNPGQLQQAISDGTVDQLRSGYDVRLDPTKTNADALQSLLQSKRSQVTAGQEFSRAQATEASVGLQNQINELLNAGKTAEATALISQLPEHLQTNFANRADKLGEVNSNNAFSKSLINNDFAAAERYADAVASSGGDAAPLYQALRQGKQTQARNNVLSQIKGLGTKYQNVLRENKANILEEAKNAGFKIKNGSVDFSSVSDPQVVKAFKERVNSLQAPTMTQLLESEFKPVYQQYMDSYGYDGNLDNQIQLFKQNISQPGTVSEFDRQQVANKYAGVRKAAADAGNIFLRQDALNAANASEDDLYGLFSDVIDGDDAFNTENMSNTERQKLAEQFVGFLTDGVQVGEEHIIPPPSVLKTLLKGANGGILTGKDFDDAVKDFMTDTTIGEQWKTAKDLKDQESADLAAIQKQSGYVDGNFFAGLGISADERLKTLNNENALRKGSSEPETNTAQPVNSAEQPPVLDDLSAIDLTRNTRGIANFAGNAIDAFKEKVLPAINNNSESLTSMDLLDNIDGFTNLVSDLINSGEDLTTNETAAIKKIKAAADKAAKDEKTAREANLKQQADKLKALLEKHKQRQSR